MLRVTIVLSLTAAACSGPVSPDDGSAADAADTVTTGDVRDATPMDARDGGACTSNADCPAGKVCSFDPGCATLTRSCQDDTSGDAVSLAFCGCDGTTFTTNQAHPTEPWSHAGPCTTDGGDIVDATDTGPVDAQPYDAGPYACGSMTCAANQVCVHPCSGIDSGMGGPQPYCQDVPLACDGTPTCDCVRPTACPGAAGGGGPTCIQSGPRDFVCQLCA